MNIPRKIRPDFLSRDNSLTTGHVLRLDLFAIQSNQRPPNNRLRNTSQCQSKALFFSPTGEFFPGNAALVDARITGLRPGPKRFKNKNGHISRDELSSSVASA
jgi:hypothetical protein